MNAQDSFVFLAYCARKDLGEDAHPADIKHHMGWLRCMKPDKFRSYLDKLFAD